MAMIRCPECRREVSDRANSCPSCGYVINANNSSGSVDFEKRIEEYKRNKYRLVKRQGDTVKLYKPRYLGLFIFATIFFGLISLFVIVAVSYLYGAICSIIINVLFAFSMRQSGTVSISITRIGNIEETGNILKKK